MDGHHSLIRWGFVIHGCIAGYSWRINFLHCSTNNLATTVLSLFEDAIRRDGGLWPSRIRVDYEVENVAVCDAMVAPVERKGQVLLQVHHVETSRLKGYGMTSI